MPELPEPHFDISAELFSCPIGTKGGSKTSYVLEESTQISLHSHCLYLSSVWVCSAFGLALKRSVLCGEPDIQRQHKFLGFTGWLQWDECCGLAL